MKNIKLKELIAETWTKLKVGDQEIDISSWGNQKYLSEDPKEQAMEKLLLENGISLLPFISEATMDKNPGFPDQDQDISGTQSMTSPGSRLMMTPGAPFGGNVAAVGNVVLSNESRVALRAWVQVAKAAWSKFGQPSRFPPEIVAQLNQLGDKFERTTGPRAPSTGYRP